jgi:hypothetical protein
MSNFLFEPTPNEEAVEFLRRKRPLNVNAYRQLLPELRAHAFTVSGIGNATALQAVRDLVAEVPAGADFRKTKKAVVEELAKHIPMEPDLFDDPDAAAKHKAMLERRAEMVVRNNAFQAYSVSAYKELDEFRDLFTHWQYLTVGDGRVRASHAALNKVTLPQGHPFWRSHFPPWEFGCRCQVVGLTEDEAMEELEASRQVPAEERWVLEGAELARLENEGQIVRKVGGVPTRINVTSGRERNEPGAWRWEPADLALSFADLKSQYDPQTWGMWESWAKQVDAGQGQSVWDWVSRALGNAGPVVVPAPVAVVPPVSTALGTPLTGKLDPVKSMTKKERARVDRVLGLIDQVHGDGPLPVIPVGHKPGKNAWGLHKSVNGVPTELHYRFKAPSPAWGPAHPEMTLVHEVGHFLDYGGMPKGSLLRATDAAATTPELKAWLDAVKGSQAWQDLQAAKLGYASTEYYNRTREMWARSYAQFIAEESGDAEMLRQLTEQVSGSHGYLQWTTADFAPIRATMKTYFQGLGWMK